jgi:hypothetical protein
MKTIITIFVWSLIVICTFGCATYNITFTNSEFDNSEFTIDGSKKVGMDTTPEAIEAIAGAVVQSNL